MVIAVATEGDQENREETDFTLFVGRSMNSSYRFFRSSPCSFCKLRSGPTRL